MYKILDSTLQKVYDTIIKGKTNSPKGGTEENMKKRVITEIKKWVDGSGYQYTETIQNEICEVANLERCDFSF